MKYLVTYQKAPGADSLAVEHFPAHRDRFLDFARRGVLVGIGLLHEPTNGDALAIFTSRQAAEEFVAGDPFVRHGVVATYTIRPWQDVLQPVPDEVG